MSTRVLLTVIFRFFAAQLIAIGVTSSSDAYVFYGLGDKDREFHGVTFDAKSEILYGIGSQYGAIYRWQTATQRPIDTITPPEKSRAVAVVPDADLAISASSENGKLLVWKLTDKELIATLAGVREEEFLALSPDGRICATRNGPVISLWSLPNGERKSRVTGHTREPFLARFSRDGRVLASVEYNTPVRLWDTERDLAIGTLDATADVLLFSPDGRNLFTTDGKLGLVWDVRLLVPVARFSLNESIQGMAFSPDGHWLLVVEVHSRGAHRWKYDPAQFHRAQAATASDRLAMLSSTQKNRQIKELPELVLSEWSTGISGKSLIFSPDARWIASASGKILLHDAAALDVTESTMPRRVLKNPDRENKLTQAIAFSPDGRQLAAVGNNDDQAVDLWDVATGKHLGAWKNEMVFDRSTLSFSSDNKLLAVTGLNSGELVTVLEIARGQPVFTADDEFHKRLQKPKYETFGSGECPAVFGPGGTTIAWIGPWGNQVMLLDVAKGKPIGQLSDPTQVAPGVPLRRDRTKFSPPYLIDDGQVNAIAFSSDGQTLAAGYEQGMVKLWDTNTGKWLRNLKDSAVDPDSYRRERGHEYGVDGLAFLPDGNILSTDTPSLKFWDAKTGALIKKLDGHYSSLSIAPDGQSFATGEIIWDRSAMRRRANLKDIVKGPRGIAFSPDGAYFAMSSGGGVVLIDGEPFEGLFTTAAISQDDARWLGRTLSRLGYLNPEAKTKAAGYRAADICHIALTLPPGAAADEIIVASIRDEVGPVLAERLGPKLAIHLCTENFQVERTINVERPVGAAVPKQPDVTQTAATPAPSIATPAVQPPKPTDELEGTWQTEKMQIDGRPAKFDETTNYRFQDKRLVIQAKNAPTANRSYSVDTTTDPHQLDVVLHRPKGDALSQMIFKIEGNMLTVCYPPAGKPRPTDFAPQAGAKHTVMVFRRVTDGLPLGDGS